MYGILDCNSFYASCERVFNPKMEGKPIVVLSNNDGCVVSMTEEAKPYITKTSEAFKLREIFEKYDIQVFSSNYSLYGDLSSRVMSILHQFSPDVEVYSIDEAFFKVDHISKENLEEEIKNLRYRITKWTGLPVSIGVAPTKALSKIANKIAKKYPVKKGVCIIHNNIQRVKALKWIAIHEVWGIGYRLSSKLKGYNITTAYGFTLLSDDFIRKKFSVVELRLKRDLLGEPTIGFEKVQPKKSIATTRTFEYALLEFEPIKERLVTFANACAEKLRRQQSECRFMYIFLKTSNYVDIKRNVGTVVTLPYTTNSSITICRYAVIGLQKLFKKGYRYKKAGVIVMGLSPENEHQFSLFSDENPKHKTIMRVMDKINTKYRKPTIKIASQDFKTWKMKQEHLSPRYTTVLNEIIEINCRR